MRKFILIATVILASLLLSCEGCMPGHEMDGRGYAHNPMSFSAEGDTTSK